ncbi:hypothetical protein CRP01_06175 [Flavilitoribacter nigricans DSM 23189 = NBRC 102662]|uniref:Uncharacterized protein n=1 Tax=Flavilitoribacter nigricans (strain ATCC 23147 / DSM 23189 / NBRC 102662 / NCIMB 1420 / SS-2) TaxID=1122177 RepID=A0A2D0NGP9_FLAN2|nr:hypothetical protein CRP01_06175 [Flavilitoribacter nigricans DSM 23189 = NBRC 102662]
MLLAMAVHGGDSGRDQDRSHLVVINPIYTVCRNREREHVPVNSHTAWMNGPADCAGRKKSKVAKSPPTHYTVPLNQEMMDRTKVSYGIYPNGRGAIAQ